MLVFNQFKNIQLLIFLLTTNVVLAQNTTITGTIINNTTNQPVEMAAVAIQETGQWTTTNEKGVFSFKDISKGKHTIGVQCLGFEIFSKAYEVDKDNFKVDIKLISSSLEIEEIVITAKEGQGLSSTSKIGKTALNHIQASSLSDVMQLIPGQVTEKFDMSGPTQIKIRDFHKEGVQDNSALGTAIIVDGVPMSNDANLQKFSGLHESYDPNNVQGKGVDSREISTDNIESIDIIRGIPSVEYGELTSGAVIISTKAGKEPLKVRLKTEPKTKQIAGSKGFLLKNNMGAINIDANILQYHSDIRKKYKGYERLTSQLGYSKIFFNESKPLSFNVKLSYFRTLDDNKEDPALIENEKEYSKDYGVRLKLFGKWSLNSKLLSNIHYKISYNNKKQEIYKQRIVSISSKPLFSSYTDFYGEGIYLPASYTILLACLPNNLYLAAWQKQYTYR